MENNLQLDEMYDEADNDDYSLCALVIKRLVKVLAMAYFL